MNIDFQYGSIEIDKEKKFVTSINIEDFPIAIDDDFNRLFSITIDSYQLLSILLIDNNR